MALRRRLSVPLVYTVHSLNRAEYELGGGPPQCVGQWGQQEVVIYGADRVISLTQSERILVQEYCPGIETRVRVVGNGIEADPITREKKQGLREFPSFLLPADSWSEKEFES